MLETVSAARPAAELPGASRRAAWRQAMLEGRILPVLLRLSLPTVAVLVVQSLVAVAETFYVGWLGTDALAGVALVSPVLMLITMMSNGGIGGGVAAAVARAAGAGRRDDADALVLHALVLALVFGLLFTAGVLLFGRALYGWLGGEGASLDAALTYSACVFAAAVPVWALNLMLAALRGIGNVRVPSLTILFGALALIPCSPLLIFGLGPVPGLGVAGAGVAVALYYLAGMLVMLRYLRSGRGGLTLRPARLRWRLFQDILHTGLLTAIGALQANLSVVAVTGAVGSVGVDAIAGYGIGSRLEFLLQPIAYGIGTAVTTMIGTNIGAGQAARARRAAWAGVAMIVLVMGGTGLLAALFPHAWLSLFSEAPDVLAVGTLYLHTIAPFYGVVGTGIVLYAAGQGFGRVLISFLAGTTRLSLAILGAWLVIRHGVGLPALFAVLATGSFLFGAIPALALLTGLMGPRRR